MCGRFALGLALEDLMAAFPGFEFPEMVAARYNIAPTQPVLAVPNTAERRVSFFQWGLVPSWATDPALGSRMINARAETAAEKPSFKAAYRRRRCLILADGFYEWRKEPGGKAKTPFYIHMADGRPFTFAGLWEVGRLDDARCPDDAGLRTCTILTCEPNELVGALHNRMPVILPSSAYDRWLDPAEQSPDALADLLRPYPAAEMAAYPVSHWVNAPQHDDPRCIEAVTET